MSKIKIGSIFLLIIYTLIVFVFGDITGSYLRGKQLSGMLDHVQGALAFNYYQDIEDLKQDLKNECLRTISDKLNFQSDEQLYLLSSFLQTGKNDELEGYVKLRSPDILRKAQTYDLNKVRSSYITFSECTKQK